LAIKTSSASQARVEINDGIASSYSSYHTGDGTFQWLQVTRTIDPAATIINVNFRVESAGSAYVQGVNAAFGPIPGAVHIPKRNEYDGRQLLREPIGLLADRLTPYGLSGTLDAQFSAAGVGNASSSVETTGFTFTVPANALDVNGKTLRVTLSGTGAANGNAKTVKMYFGATVISCLPGETQSAALYTWQTQMTLMRTGTTAQDMTCTRYMGLTALAGSGGQAAAAETLSNAIVVKGTLTSASASDLIAYTMITELLTRPIQ
jgi:hypothetical protein